MSIILVLFLLVDELEFKVISYRTEILELAIELNYWFVKMPVIIHRNYIESCVYKELRSQKVALD